MHLGFNRRAAILLGFSSILVSVFSIGCSGSSSSGGPAPKVEIKNLKPRIKSSAVAVVGDSYAAGIGARNSASTIESCLRRELGLTSVSTVADEKMTSRDTAQLFTALTNVKPRVVIISLGGNDLFFDIAGKSFPVAETTENLRKFYRQLTDKGVLVIQLGLNPPLPGNTRFTKVAEVAATEGVVYVPDILEGLWEDSRYMADAIRPNDAGYAKVCERVVAAMKPLYSESR